MLLGKSVRIPMILSTNKMCACVHVCVCARMCVCVCVYVGTTIGLGIVLVLICTVCIVLVFLYFKQRKSHHKGILILTLSPPQAHIGVTGNTLCQPFLQIPKK